MNFQGKKSRKFSQHHSNRTKVLLCQAWDYFDEGKVNAKKQLNYRWNTPNYGMVLLATMAQKAGHSVELLDAEAELVMKAKGDPTYILEYRIPSLLTSFRPDIVGISCTSARWSEAYRMAKAFDYYRKKGNNFKLILGGFHPTSQFEEVFKQAPFIDWLHIGESERSFLSVLGGGDPRSLSGIAWHDSGIIRHTLPQPVDLDSLPFPNWNLLDITYYCAPNQAMFIFYPGALRILPLLCSRGCIYRCSFCTYKHQVFRRHSIEYIGDYLEYLIFNYKVNAIFPYDSFLSGDYLQQICELIIKKGINKRLTWGCALRANTVKREDILALARANCCKVFYGFESGSEQMLIRMNKKATVEDGLRVSQYHHDVKLPFNAMMIFGYPGEDLQDVQLTQQFLVKSKPYDTTINIFSPMPGSYIYDELQKENKIIINEPSDYRKYSYYDSAYGCKGHRNFTAMDDKTYELAYKELVRTANEISAAVRKQWMLEKLVDNPLKACMVYQFFPKTELEKMGTTDSVKCSSLLPQLSTAGDFFIALDKLEYRCKDNPVANLLLNGLLYPMLLVMLFIYMRLPKSLRRFFPVKTKIFNVFFSDFF